MHRDDALHISSNYDENKVGLPFIEEQQQAVIGHCLTRVDFFRQMQTQVQANWFGGPYLSQIFTQYQGYFKLFGHAPASIQEFDDWVTNNVTDTVSTNGTIPDISTGAYATDYVNLRNALFQLARLVKQDHDALRTYGLMT